MLNKPINNIVKEHFTKIRNAAKQKAKIDFKLNVLEKIEGLDNYQKLVFCAKEEDRIDNLIEKDPKITIAKIRHCTSFFTECR